MSFPQPGVHGGHGLRGGWREVLPRTTFTGVSEYQVNNITGYRRLVFLVESLQDTAAALDVNFEVGVAGPTFRTSGYVTFHTAAVTDCIADVPTAGAGNVMAAWVIEVFNASDAGEKTTAKTRAAHDASVRTSIGRYDTAEANTCFRIRDINGNTFDAIAAITVLGKV